MATVGQRAGKAVLLLSRLLLLEQHTLSHYLLLLLLQELGATGNCEKEITQRLSKHSCTIMLAMHSNAKTKVIRMIGDIG